MNLVYGFAYLVDCERLSKCFSLLLVRMSSFLSFECFVVCM